MRFNHIGLVNNDEEKAREFYGQILGFEEVNEFNVSQTLSKKLFGLDGELKVLLFVKSDLKLEIFITEQGVTQSPVINHVCLEVSDPEELLEKCVRSGVEVIKIQRNERPLIFIKDFSGNLFEIKALSKTGIK